MARKLGSMIDENDDWDNIPDHEPLLKEIRALEEWQQTARQDFEDLQKKLDPYPQAGDLCWASIPDREDGGWGTVLEVVENPGDSDLAFVLVHVHGELWRCSIFDVFVTR